MPREQPEQGIRRSYSARYRLSCPPAKGMDDSHDPSTVPDENLVQAINTRVHDGIYVSRAGQQKATDLMTGKVSGMVEIDNARSCGLVLVLGTPYTATTNHIWTWNGSQLKSSNIRVPNGNYTEFSKNLLSIRGDSYALEQDWSEAGFTDSHLIRVQPPDTGTSTAPPPPFGDGSQLQSNILAAYNLLNDPMAGYYDFVASIATISYGDQDSSDGQRDAIFASTGRGGIYVYDAIQGLRVIYDEVTPDFIDYWLYLPVLCTYRDTLYVAWGSPYSDKWVPPAVGKFNFWAQGRSLDEATWTGLTLPAMETQTIFPCGGSVLNDVLYIAFSGYPDQVGFGYAGFLEVDGDTVTKHLIGQAWVPDEGSDAWIRCTVTHNDYLYYSWYERIFPDSPWNFYVGRYDGTTWDDYWLDTGTRWVTAMLSAGGQLYLADTAFTDPTYDSFIYVPDGEVVASVPGYVVTDMVPY